MTDAIAPAPAAPSAPLSDNELAKLLLVAERECKAAERAREGLRADMLARMEASGLGRLELAGEGLALGGDGAERAGEPGREGRVIGSGAGIGLACQAAARCQRGCTLMQNQFGHHGFVIG